MEFIEVNGDLFDTNSYTSEEVVFAHCIGSDFGMFGGIAVQFIEHYDMKKKLFEWAGEFGIETQEVRFAPTPFSRVKIYARPDLVGLAVKIDNVYNLITKPLTAGLPELYDLVLSLEDMRDQMLQDDDRVLAIPDMIGCGIDSLDRQEVVEAICEVFKDTDIKIYAVNLV